MPPQQMLHSYAKLWKEQYKYMAMFTVDMSRLVAWVVYGSIIRCGQGWGVGHAMPFNPALIGCQPAWTIILSHPSVWQSGNNPPPPLTPTIVSIRYMSAGQWENHTPSSTNMPSSPCSHQYGILNTTSCNKPTIVPPNYLTTWHMSQHHTPLQDTHHRPQQYISMAVRASYPPPRIPPSSQIICQHGTVQGIILSCKKPTIVPNYLSTCQSGHHTLFQETYHPFQLFISMPLKASYPPLINPPSSPTVYQHGTVQGIIFSSNKPTINIDQGCSLPAKQCHSASHKPIQSCDVLLCKRFLFSEAFWICLLEFFNDFVY